MSALQKINLGTPPMGKDGDDVRTANTRMNANVDVLNAQAALTSAVQITAAQALTAAHIGKRVNISLAAAGVINLPAANVGAADNVVLLRNIGTAVVTLAITAGSGDSLALSKLNPGEAALLDTDGVHAWSVLMRGRTNSDNETVNGTLSVTGKATLLGGIDVTGNVSNSGRVLIATQGPTNVANVFNNLAAYDEYELLFEGLLPTLNAQDIGIHFSNDNGNTWLTTAQYRYSLNYTSSAGANAVGYQSALSNITLWNTASNVSGNPTFATYEGRIHLRNFRRPAVCPTAQWEVAGVSSADNTWGQTRGSGQFLGLTGLNINAFRIFSGGAGFSRGSLKLYGIN